MRTQLLLTALLSLGMVSTPRAVHAQGPAPAPQKMAFEVASVKPNNSGDTGSAWVHNDRFDIIGKYPSSPPPTPSSVPAMVQEAIAQPDGTYDFEVRFAAAALAATPVDGRALPSIFTAMREQLGLRLESARGPVDFYVIDRLERPTPD